MLDTLFIDDCIAFRFLYIKKIKQYLRYGIKIYSYILYAVIDT